MRSTAAIVRSPTVGSRSGSAEQVDAEAQRAERLPPFVRRHPRELLEPLVLIRDRLRVERDERFHGRLRQDVHRLVQARDERDALGRRRYGCEPLHFLQHEGDEHAAQHLVFAQYLVQRRALAVPERAELARLVENRGVGGNRAILGVAQILADLDDQRRDVIEQALGREDVAGFDRQQIEQPLEPARGQRAMLDAASVPRSRRRSR